MTKPENKQTEQELKREKEQKTMNAVNKWASFYRANPHRFAKDYLNLKLKRFQQIILCMMFKFVNMIYLASRGGGKSFLLAIFCSIYCILFPGTTICIASGTRGQATEVLDKIQKDLMQRSANLRSEISEIIVNQSKAEVTFRNGSHIKVVTSKDSARHNRATILIVDEFRMVNKNIIDTVLRKFLTAPRRPGYLEKPQYENHQQERTKELYASSCWYKDHWSYEHVRSYVVNMIKGRSYFCCSMPYQLAIKERLLDRLKVEDEMSESTFDSITFQIEMEALFFGKGEGGLYRFDEIDRNRIIELPFYPADCTGRLIDKRLSIPFKKPGEKRILSADIALLASTTSKQNDATSIFINQMSPMTNGSFVNNIVYTTNDEGLRTDDQALKIRKMFEEYDCDYLVIDARGLGIGVLDLLMSNLYDPQTGITYGALSCCNNEELAKRCKVKNAPKKIWAILGSPEFNSRCALELRESFKQGKIRLLKSEYEAEDKLSSIKGYDNLTPEESIRLRLPYVHTSLLVNELINLEYEVKNNVIKVKEKNGKRKDRYSSLSYNIYVAKQIERDASLSTTKNIQESVAIHFRAPQLKKKY